MVYEANCFFVLLSFSLDSRGHYWFRTDALAWINVFYKEIDALKERQKLLKEYLQIFGLSQPDSLELVELEEVRWTRSI